MRGPICKFRIAPVNVTPDVISSSALFQLRTSIKNIYPARTCTLGSVARKESDTHLNAALVIYSSCWELLLSMVLFASSVDPPEPLSLGIHWWA